MTNEMKLSPQGVGCGYEYQSVLYGRGQSPKGQRDSAAQRQPAKLNLGTSLVGPLTKTPRCQCRGPKFHPWSAKIPHATPKIQNRQINK